MATNVVTTIMPDPAASIEELRRVRAVLLAVDRDAELEDALVRVETSLIDELRRARELRRTRDALEVIADALAAGAQDGRAA
jgi:hypothetical protein